MRELTEAQFEQLLRVFDPDREAAALRYESMRRALASFFAFRGAPDPEALTDETVNRVARRLDEGARIVTSDAMSYFYGVARNVWREQYARMRRAGPLPGDAGSLPDSRPDPLMRLLDEARRAEAEARLVCLEKCMGTLTSVDREMMIEYYQDSGPMKINRRQALAARQGISMKTLRNKTTLLRARLESCVGKCLPGANP